MAFVEGTKSFKGEKAYTRAEALQHFRDAEAMTHKPFIYLSAGVSNPVFIETLELAGESGTNSTVSFAAEPHGRMASPSLPSRVQKPSSKWLETTGVENINNVNNALKAASPWYLKFGASSLEALS